MTDILQWVVFLGTPLVGALWWHSGEKPSTFYIGCTMLTVWLVALGKILD